MAAAAELEPTLEPLRIDDLRVAVSEATTNAIQAHIRSGCTRPVRVTCRCAGGRVSVVVGCYRSCSPRWRYRCFNEAGARTPRKRRIEPPRRRAPMSRFNEAGARTPRKSRPHRSRSRDGRLRRVASASMRPGRVRPGRAARPMPRGLGRPAWQGCFNEAGARTPRKSRYLAVGGYVAARATVASMRPGRVRPGRDPCSQRGDGRRRQSFASMRPGRVRPGRESVASSEACLCRIGASMRPGRVRPGRASPAQGRSARVRAHGPLSFNEAGARTPRKRPPMLNPRGPCRLRGEFESSGTAPATLA